MLYRNFPLIGSNEFSMPFMIDGFNFNPLESRSGILLNGFTNKNNLDAHEKINILDCAFEASIDFIKCMIGKYKILKNRFLLATSKNLRQLLI